MSAPPGDSPVFQLAGGFTVRALALAPGMAQEGQAAWAGDPDVPDLGELIRHALASRRGAWMLEFRQSGRVAATFPVCLDARKVRGIPLRTLSFAGYDFFDYLPLPQGDVPDFIWLAGLRRLCAHFGADAACLNHLTAPPAGGLARFAQPFSNLCFDATAAGGWTTLLDTQSVRRIVNKARRLYRYRVESFDGLPPPELFATIAKLHIERWRYDDVASAFLQPARRDEYQAQAQRALSIVLFDGDRVMAALVGFVFGNRLLFHTPVINIEYLAASLLKLLIHETAAECARRNLQVLDLGLGDEAYKRRYGNTARPVWNLFVPRTIAARFALALLREDRLTGWKRRLSAWRSARRHRRLPPPRVLLLDPSSAQRPAAAVSWREISSFDAYVRDCRELAIVARRLDYERFKAGARCLLALNGEKPLAKYWVRAGTSWSDPSSPFELTAAREMLWVFGAEDFSDTMAEALLPGLAARYGNAPLRYVCEAGGRGQGREPGLMPAGDVTQSLAGPDRNEDSQP